MAARPTARSALAPAPRPSSEELAAARSGQLRDLLQPDLRVLFIGINPSLYSAALDQHFARPGNRFWTTLHRAGFTERVLHPSEQDALLDIGVGLTNVVPRPSAAAAELERSDYESGVAVLRRKLRRYRPRALAFLGLGAYRLVAGQPGASVGRQVEPFEDVETWALPNPSGLNAHYSIAALVNCYAELARAVLPKSWPPAPQHGNPGTER